MANPAESKPGSGISFELGETRAEPAMTNLEDLPDVTPVVPTLQTIRHNYTAGEVIAEKYRLLSLLGEGGMGTVWVAHNEVLDVQVALKLIRSEAGSVGNTERLLNEARAAACLKDPGIVTIFDFGATPWGDPFIVMEVLNGEDLDQAIQRKGHLNPLKAVRVLLPIAKALGMAHSRGIIHRDLKPENIFLAITNDGGLSPKLLDFGIAKVDHGPTLRLTTTGTLMGSPLYMSPEQARGDEATYASDIWALSVVLYECIAGDPPFAGANYNAVLFGIANNDPDPDPILEEADDHLWAIIAKGLAKDPEDRWQSMDELGKALAEWLLEMDTFEDITGVSIQLNWLQAAGGYSALTSIPPQPNYPLEHITLPKMPLPTTTPSSRRGGPPTSRAAASRRQAASGDTDGFFNRRTLRRVSALVLPWWILFQRRWEALPIRVRAAAIAFLVGSGLVLGFAIARSGTSEAEPQLTASSQEVTSDTQVATSAIADEQIQASSEEEVSPIVLDLDQDSLETSDGFAEDADQEKPAVESPQTVHQRARQRKAFRRSKLKNPFE